MEPGPVIPGFRELQLLKRTPWAEIYRTIHEESGREVALKLTPAVREIGDISLQQLAPVLWSPDAAGCLRKHEANVLRALQPTQPCG